MKQGDIVLIPFPFTDLSDYKVRPALVISNHSFNQKRNLILMSVSTKSGIPSFSISLSQKDLTGGTLNKASFLRSQNVFTLEKRLVIKRVATLKKEKLKKIVEDYQGYFLMD